MFLFGTIVVLYICYKMVEQVKESKMKKLVVTLVMFVIAGAFGCGNKGRAINKIPNCQDAMENVYTSNCMIVSSDNFINGRTGNYLIVPSDSYIMGQDEAEGWCNGVVRFVKSECSYCEAAKDEWLKCMTSLDRCSDCIDEDNRLMECCD